MKTVTIHSKLNSFTEQLDFVGMPGKNKCLINGELYVLRDVRKEAATLIQTWELYELFYLRDTHNLIDVWEVWEAHDGT